MIVRETSRWVSYEDAAILLGLSPEATRRLTRRHAWPRRSDPLGRTLVSVPETLPQGEAEECGIAHGESPPVQGESRTLMDHLELRVEELTQELADARMEMRGVRYEAESLRIDAGRVQVFAALVEAERARSVEIKAERDRLLEELTRDRRPWLRRLLEDAFARPPSGRRRTQP